MGTQSGALRCPNFYSEARVSTCFQRFCQTLIRSRQPAVYIKIQGRHEEKLTARHTPFQRVANLLTFTCITIVKI